jgi:hypothetical protein
MNDANNISMYKHTLVAGGSPHAQGDFRNETSEAMVHNQKHRETDFSFMKKNMKDRLL